MLGRFAETHGITYPLLADVGSVAITEIGILNVTLEQERAAYGRPIEERHTGIPYPGSFFLDEDGVVTGKRFEQSHRIRPTGNTLLRELFGDESIQPAVSAESSSPGVRVAAWLDTAVTYANQLQEVHVRFDLDDGAHLYTEPVPDGFHAMKVELGGDDRLQPDPVAMPEGHEFQITGLEETFHVVDGTVELTAPFILLSNRDTAGDASRPVSLTVDVAYQACTGDECFMPERVTLELPLTEEPNPGYETVDFGSLGPLVIRRIMEAPMTEEELLVVVNAALEGVEVAAPQLEEVLETLAGRNIVVLGSDGRWAQKT